MDMMTNAASKTLYMMNYNYQKKITSNASEVL